MRFSFLFRTVFTIILIVILTSSMLKFSSDKIKSTYEEIALKECRTYISGIISETIDDSIDEEEFSSSFIIENEDDYKEFNVTYIQSLLKKISNNMYEKVKKDEVIKICDIPFSLVFDNPLISFIGPNIPISIKLIADVLVDVHSKVSSFGINNALIEILIDFEFEILIFVPLSVTSEKIDIDFPIYSSLFEGEVPSIAFGEHDIL